MSKFRVGDKVRIKEDLKVGCEYNDGCYFVPYMEKYNGKVAVIKSYYISAYFNGNMEIKNDDKYRYRLDIDDGRWQWSSSMLEKVEDKKHFKSLPRDFTGTIDVEKGFIVKKEILDEVEKEYLGAVIRPFKERIANIQKKIEIAKYIDEYILINMRDNEHIVLPYFKKGTMYKNMKIGIKYTLQELGLD